MINAIKKYGVLVGSWLLFAAMLVLVILTAVYSSNPSSYRVQPADSLAVVGADFMPGGEEVVYAENVGEGGVLTVAAPSGEVISQRKFDQPVAGLWRVGESLFLSFQDKQFIILGADGEQIAAGKTAYPVKRALLQNGKLVVLTSLNVSKNIVLIAEGELTGELAFKQISTMVQPLNAGVLSDGSVYLGMGNSTIRKLSGDSFVEVGKTSRAVTDFTAAGDRLFALLENGTLEAYTPAAGALNKDESFQLKARGGVLAQSSDTLVAAAEDGSFFVYDAEARAVRATFNFLSLPKSIAVSDFGTVLLTKSERPFSYLDLSLAGRLQFASKTQTLWVILLIVMAVVCLCTTMWVFVMGRRKVKTFFTRLWKGRKSYMFLAPTMLLLLVFSYYPLVWGFVIAFQNYVPGIQAEFLPNPFGNFIEVFQDAAFWGGVKNMLIFLVTDLLKALIPPLIMAELIQSVVSKRSSYWAKLVMFIPGIVPGVASLLLWTDGILGAGGVMNQILRSLGVSEFLGDVSLLQRQSTAMFGLIFIGFPWVGSYLIFAGALMGVPNSMFEAAELDGCGYFRRIISMDIPMISPQMKYIFVTCFISSVQDFGRVYLTTEGNYGTNIPAFQLYRNIMDYHNYGVASAMGIILFLFIFGATLLNLRMQTAKTEV